MISRLLFMRIGLAVFGEDWQRPMAQSLMCSERAVQRMAHGDQPVPDSMKPELIALVRGRAETLISEIEEA